MFIFSVNMKDEQHNTQQCDEDKYQNKKKYRGFPEASETERVIKTFRMIELNIESFIIFLRRVNFHAEHFSLFFSVLFIHLLCLFYHDGRWMMRNEESLYQIFWKFNLFLTISHEHTLDER